MTDAYHQQVLAQLEQARADRRSLEDEVALLRQRAALALAVLNGWGPAGHEAEQMRHEIREALTCPSTAQPVDTCHTVTIDGEAVRVRGSGELGPEGEAALAEVIRAAKRRMATEPPDVQDGSRLRAHQERIRARLAAAARGSAKPPA